MEITPENAYETIIQIVGQEVAETIRVNPFNRAKK